MLHVASAVLHALLQTSPTQLVVVLFFEVILYGLNYMINIQYLKVTLCRSDAPAHASAPPCVRLFRASP